MKVLLVNGSPHKKGCIDMGLSVVAETLMQEGIDTEIFHIGTKPISGCMFCGKCMERKECVINDVVNEFIEKARTADGFIFGDPVYYVSMNGAMSAFMDRAFFAGNNDTSLMRLKPAACIVNARRAGNTATFDQMNRYLEMSEMPVISSTYWNMTHGFTPEDVVQDLEGIQTLKNLGKNMAYFLKCKEAGEKAGIKRPEVPEAVRTHFIR